MDAEQAEPQLIKRILAGEGEAYRHLVETYQDRVYRLCRLMMGQSAAAEDLAQDTFLRAFRKLDRFDPARGNFANWLLTIARRLCLNALQKRQHRALLEEAQAHVPLSSQDEGPMAHAARSESLRAIDRALAQLPPDQQRAFIFAEIEGMPHHDIAQIEGIAIGTVKSRVSRAKLALRGSLRSLYEELDRFPTH
jgi:RNA polymerase sigma-70 factor (ECF subfamily)